MSAPLIPEAEREPAERKRLTYTGDRVDELKERHYFGPTYRADGGAGRVWRFASAEYDAEKNVTVAWFAPVSERELQAVMDAIHRRQAQQQHG